MLTRIGQFLMPYLANVEGIAKHEVDLAARERPTSGNSAGAVYVVFGLEPLSSDLML